MGPRCRAHRTTSPCRSAPTTRNSKVEVRAFADPSPGQGRTESVKVRSETAMDLSDHVRRSVSSEFRGTYFPSLSEPPRALRWLDLMCVVSYDQSTASVVTSSTIFELFRTGVLWVVALLSCCIALPGCGAEIKVDGCASDLDCKGTRVCVSRSCQEPITPPQEDSGAR